MKRYEIHVRADKPWPLIIDMVEAKYAFMGGRCNGKYWYAFDYDLEKSLNNIHNNGFRKVYETDLLSNARIRAQTLYAFKETV